MFTKIKHFLFGSPRDPFDKETRKNISLIAFLAWIGLGADGISSSCYGPEEAFLALGNHPSLAIYLAIATAITVFIISYAYIQVIELFPNGGGGYRVASRLLGPYFGLVSGSALIIDYVLTISISVASAIDAIFSFLPHNFHFLKILIEILLILLLAFLNLRGSKESIKFLMPIFLGFIITHIFLIIYGIVSHHSGIASLIPNARQDSQDIKNSLGLVFLISTFLKAFSMGGGTYTGLEAVSNNVHTLAEPRVKTAKITMFMVAFSLAFMASGIILIYLLWDINKIDGQTLNATVFYAITDNWSFGDIKIGQFLVPAILILEAGLLFVAANSGFLAGPNVVANMAHDEWMPKSFSSLSSRLVVKNGIAFMTIAAIATLIITNGSVHILVVLYSINVFITFSLSLLGLSFYWFRHRKKKSWLYKLIVAIIGFTVCFGILIITIIEKFFEGGWVTLLITSIFVIIGVAIKKSYRNLKSALLYNEIKFPKYESKNEITSYGDKNMKTAAIILEQNLSSGMNCLIEIEKMFPSVFKNFVFVTVGELDANIFREEKKWQDMRLKTKNILRKYRNYCHHFGNFAKSYVGYSTDPIEKLSQLTERVKKDYPNTIFFGTKFIFDNENIFTQTLYNHTPAIMQQKLHNQGLQMILLPMKINNANSNQNLHS
jgi:amino acid transporter